MAANASAQLHLIAQQLKAAGAGGIKREMVRDLKVGAAPLIPAVKAAARSELPHEGGLNEHVASQKITVSVRTGARTAGVRLITTTPATQQTNEGFVRHPTFKRRGKGDWKVTKTRKGWWTNTLAHESPSVTPVLLRGMEKIAAKIRAV